MKFKSILIVDDSPTSQMIIKRCFEIAGFGEAEYTFAGDGVEALQILSERAFDLLITDLNMPKCNGISLLHELRNKPQGREMKIVVVSSIAGNASDECNERIIGVIRKPISPRKIIETIGEDHA